jgi:glucosyl-3-phosphoglycerate synthase
VLGKGDAMWRALAAARSDLVVYIDADTRDFSPAFVSGLLGPLMTDSGAQFAKATYHRPYSSGGHEVAGGGGRVSQLTARPLLAAFYPDLAGLVQPLAGEVAAPRQLFERIPFATGYSVEAAMLLDLRETIGADAIAQVDLGERRNAHQSLDALRPMAESVLAVITDRLHREGRLAGPPAESPLVVRPPFASLALA